MSVATVRRLRLTSTTGVVLLLTATVAACASSSPAPTSAGVTKTPASPAASPAALSPTALVQHVALANSDFSDGRTVRLYVGGDQVAGQVTLDYCGSAFTTESHRVARRQSSIVSVKRRRDMFSNEVVAYDSTEQAAKAIGELRRAVTDCPTGVFVDEAVQGVPDLRYDVSKLSTLASLPAKDNAVAVATISAKGTSRHLYGLAIFQRQGTVLNIVYLQSTKKLTSGELAAARSMAQITGKRLAAS